MESKRQIALLKGLNAFIETLESSERLVLQGYLVEVSQALITFNTLVEIQRQQLTLTNEGVELTPDLQLLSSDLGLFQERLIIAELALAYSIDEYLETNQGDDPITRDYLSLISRALKLRANAND